MKAIVSFRIFYFKSPARIGHVGASNSRRIILAQGRAAASLQTCLRGKWLEITRFEGSDGETIAALVTKVIHSLLPRWSNFLEVVDRYEAELSCVIYLAGDERPQFTLQMN